MYASRGKLLTFDDVLIEPRKSSITSRSNVNTSTKVCGYPLDVPVLSANMDTITEESMASAMYNAGGLGVLHRFASLERRREMAANLEDKGIPCAFTIGLDDDIQYMMEPIWLTYNVVKFMVLDVAHGHQTQVLEKVEEIRQFIENTGSSLKLIVGNVVTRRGARDLINAGADGVKVGVGPGSVCTTRIMTGCGKPQLSAIEGVASVLREYANTTLIADGGIRKPADVVKALAAGANAVMVGGWFAGTDAAANSHEFRGMASREAAEENGKTCYAPEGISTEVVPRDESVEQILQNIKGGLQSGMSYVGARNIHELQERARFIRVSETTKTENQTLW